MEVYLGFPIKISINIITLLLLIPLLSNLNRRPYYIEAIEVVKTYQGVLSFIKSKEILKKIGLEIDTKSYYNLRRKEQSQSLSPYEEALYLLYKLKAQEVYIIIKEKYIVNREGNKIDYIIKCIT